MNVTRSALLVTTTCLICGSLCDVAVDGRMRRFEDSYVRHGRMEWQTYRAGEETITTFGLAAKYRLAV